MKRNIVFATVCFIIALLFLVAFFSPVKNMQRYVPNGDCIRALTRNDISQMNDCEISSSGEFIVTGVDPYIVFENVNLPVKGIVFNVIDKFKDKISGQVFIDVGQGFDEGLSSYEATVAGTPFLCFSISGENVHSIRLDIVRYSEFAFQSIEIYADSPKLEEFKIYPSFSKVLLAVGVAVLIGLFAYLYDKRMNVSFGIINVIKRNYLRIIIFILGIIVIGILSIGIECIVSQFYSFQKFSLASLNHYRYLFICHILIAVYCFAWFSKYLDKKPENMFLSLVLVTGSMMITVAPFGANSWDEAIHYRWADNASYYEEADISMADYLYDMMSDYVGVKANPQENSKAIETMNKQDLNLVGYHSTDTTIAHRVSGLFIAVARMLGCSFYETYMIGKYGVLLVYAVVCFFAMKKLKSGKMIMAIIALFPTSMFLATSYSYDYWVTCFSMLGMACFVSELQKPQQMISVKDTMIMVGAFAVACLPKMIYAILLIIPFFMVKRNWNKKEYRRYYGICSIAVIILGIMLAIIALQQIGGPGDLRGGADVNPTEQVAYIFQNPFTYARDLVNFMRTYLIPARAEQYMVHMAYLGIGSGATVIMGLLIFATITDRKEDDVYSSTWLNRIGIGGLFFASIALIATSLYIAFTPVGSRVIKGCQYRYLIPLLFPFLSIIGSPKFAYKMKYNWYNGIIMGIMVTLCYYNVYTLMLPILM